MDQVSQQNVIHELKCWPLFFGAVRRGVKTFEIRFNDRDFKEGDILRLCEWDPTTKKYTGRREERYVTYVLEDSSMGLKPGFIAMGITHLRRGT
jgi:hypothetical protein